MGFVRLQNHLDEGAAGIVDAVPADIEGALPFLARAFDEAGAAADAGVVEQQVDVVAVEFACDGVAKLQNLFFNT